MTAASASAYSPGSGTPALIAITTPAAGAEWTHTVPARVRCRLIGISGILTTDATATTRYPNITLTRAGLTYTLSAGANAPAASCTTLILWAPAFGAGAQSAGVLLTRPFPPDITLIAADVLTSTTTNIAGGDQYSALVMHIEEWLEP